MPEGDADQTVDVAPVQTSSGREPAVPFLSESELRAWRGLLEVGSRLLPDLEAELQKTTGLTLSEFDVLYQIWRAPRHRLRMKDLAEALLVTPSGVTRIVDRLSTRGWVERVSKQGRQAVETRLLPAGQAGLDEAMRVHFAGVRRMFIDSLSEADIAHLVAAWTRLGLTGYVTVDAGFSPP
jgi:DNA-binding MarR family transcriptional regulator